MEYINGYSGMLLVVLVFLLVIRRSWGVRKEEDTMPGDNVGKTIHKRERTEGKSSPQRGESDR